jgi:chromosome segregation ATPase
MVQAAIASLPENDPLRARIAAVATVQGRVREVEARLSTLSREIAAYAERAAELRAQIAELRAARTGAQLQKELERSLAEIERAQSKATAEAAAQKDALTVSRIAFQNAVAELTLGPSERVLARGG